MLPELDEGVRALRTEIECHMPSMVKETVQHGPPEPFQSDIKSIGMVGGGTRVG